MTTIAYRDRILAADDRLTGQSTIWGSVEKIANVGDRWYVGAAGDLDQVTLFLDWARAQKAVDRRGLPRSRPPMLNRDTEALVVTAVGTVYLWTGSACFTRLTAPFYALGSGAKLAMGAMAFGATAAEAVEIAARYDIYTGGSVTTLSI